MTKPSLPCDRVRVAVIGVGALGRHHARLLAEAPDAELVGVADPNPEQGATVAELCGTTWFADYRTLLDRQGVDGVSIVVPTALHERIAEDCLRRGIHVLVEKPITPSVAAGESVCRLADSQQRMLQVGHIERFNPAFVELQRRTAAPKYIRAERLAPYSFRSLDISVVLDLMIHDIDLVLALNGAAPARVEAFGLCVFGGQADIVQGRMAFSNGCVADLTASRVSPDVRRRLQVWSEAGCWTADLQEQQLEGYGPGPLLRAGRFPRDLGTAAGADIPALKQQLFEQFLERERPVVEKRNALQDELGDFLRSIRTGDSPRVDGWAGLEALRVAESIAGCVEVHSWDGASAGRVGPFAHPLCGAAARAA